MPGKGQRVARPPTQYEEVAAWAKDGAAHAPQLAVSYLRTLFPIVSWLPRYNLTWLYGDLIAGLTVGLVVIPQAISYSTKLAGLPAQYGLYSSFIGVLTYAFFATTKDVTIGPTSVLSLLVGQTLANYDGSDTVNGKVVFAVTLSFFIGLIQLALGLFRFGIIVDLVPVSVISGFTTGAGLQIIVGQLPGITGVKNITTTDAPYLVFYNWAKNLNTLPNVKYDLAFGLSALFFILAFRFITEFFTRRTGNKLFKYIGLLRNGLAVIIFTLISWGARSSVKISIVGNVPSGFGSLPSPKIVNDNGFLNSLFQGLPAVLIVSILEHVAVAKSYGRINGYNPNDNQELVAIGVTNLVGSFVGAYPATGSFSRTAIKSASGVRSPLAAFFTGAIVLVSIFALTPAFYWIPNAVLSAVIIAAVTDLFATPQTIKNLWDTQFIDLVGFLIAFVVTIFVSIEWAIYSAVLFSFVVLLIRIARPHVRILARKDSSSSWVDEAGERFRSYNEDASAESESLSPPPPGIIVFRADESFTYPNASYLLSKFKEVVIDRFAYTGKLVTKGERSWDDDTADRVRLRGSHSDLPELRAVVFDFSAVNNIDYTGLQTILDTKADLERFAGRPVPFHFAYVRRQHVRVLWSVASGALTAAGVDAGPARLDEGEEAVVGDYGDVIAWRRFHESIDEAVKAAHEETIGYLQTETPEGWLSASKPVTIVTDNDKAQTIPKPLEPTDSASADTVAGASSEV